LFVLLHIVFSASSRWLWTTTRSGTRTRLPWTMSSSLLAFLTSASHASFVRCGSPVKKNESGCLNRVF
jgi:hypothetical protein